MKLIIMMLSRDKKSWKGYEQQEKTRERERERERESKVIRILHSFFKFQGEVVEGSKGSKET